jgi:ligand-binding sensor domain-containing protein
VWVGGNDGTLAYFKDSTWALQTISIKSSLTCLAEDSTGNLWIGTKNGVIKKKDGRDTVYTISDGLGSNIVTAVFVDKNNTIWVGTYNGLTCFEDGVFKQTYLRPCGIAGNFITSICQNVDGVLWIGTDRGISTLTISKTAVKKRVLLEQTRSKASTHKIITLGKSSKAGPETAGAFLLNGKKGTLAIKKNRSRTVNCYLVTE